MNNLVISQFPPSYTDPKNIETWISDIFNGPGGLPCVCSDYTRGNSLHVVRPQIIRICQRSDQPCKIDIDFHLGTAQGIFEYSQSESAFSIDSTNGFNGTWHELVPDYTDDFHNLSLNNTALAGSNKVDGSWNYSLFNPSNPSHVGNDPCTVNFQLLGIPVHRFTFDMCEHINTWFSEPNFMFRITFNKEKQNQPITPLSCGARFR